MLTPIRCMHCRLPVGDIASVFNMIRYERVKEELKKAGVVPSQASADLSLQVDMTDVFEDLGVEDDCCRGTLATAIDMREVY